MGYCSSACLPHKKVECLELVTMNAMNEMLQLVAKISQSLDAYEFFLIEKLFLFHVYRYIYQYDVSSKSRPPLVTVRKQNIKYYERERATPSSLGQTHCPLQNQILGLATKNEE